MHEPRRTGRDLRRLRERRQTDPEFASLAFDIGEVMSTHNTTPNLMRAALRLVLHEEAWRKYKRENCLVVEEEEVEEEEDDGCDPLDL